MIDIKNLWKSYGKRSVLRGLNLEVTEGETVVILGSSGVGKSVLLRQMLGLEKPDQGTVTVNGVCVSNLDGKDLYTAIRQMGMLFQGGALFDSMTIGENTAFYLTQHGDLETGQPIPEEEIRKRVSEALGMVGLVGVEDEMPSNLSGGMRKRAALARAIIYRPHILLYDEPTTGLDPITAATINELIVKMQKDLKITSIVVTHDLKSAMTVANRIALHDDGKIAYIADKYEFIKSDHPLIRTFLRNAELHVYNEEDGSNKK
jgi:phospholipid/cholesterol/gamma-HCH transport system ATP-binding protein